MKYPRIYLIVPQAQKISSYLSTTFFIGNMLTEKNLRNFFLNFKTFFIKIFFQVTIFIVKYVYIRLQLIKVFISISISTSYNMYNVSTYICTCVKMPTYFLL